MVLAALLGPLPAQSAPVGCSVSRTQDYVARLDRDALGFVPRLPDARDGEPAHALRCRAPDGGGVRLGAVNGIDAERRTRPELLRSHDGEAAGSTGDLATMARDATGQPVAVGRWQVTLNASELVATGATVTTEPGGEIRLRPTSTTATGYTVSQAVRTMPLPLWNTGWVGVSGVVEETYKLIDRDARLELHFLDASGNVVGQPVITDRAIGTSGPTPVSGYGRAPSNATHGRLSLTVNGYPQAWVQPLGQRADFGPTVDVWQAAEVAISGLPPYGMMATGEGYPVAIVITPPQGVLARDLVWSAELRDAAGAVVRPWSGTGAVHSLTLGSVPIGYYTLHWAVSHAGLLLRSGDEPLAVMDVYNRPRPSPFGIATGFDGYQGASLAHVPLLSALLDAGGLRSLRSFFNIWAMWPAATGAKKANDPPFTYLTNMRNARQWGLEPYVTLSVLPRWLSKATPEDNEWYKAAANDLGAYREYCEWAAKTFANEISVWEVMNEPDGSVYFHGRPEELAGMQKACYLGIKAGNPRARVTTASWTGNPKVNPEWPGVVHEQIYSYYDVYNVHNYNDPPRFAADMTKIRAMQQSYGLNLPVWVTETGHFPYREMSPTQDADYFVKQYTVAISEGVQRVFGYKLEEHGEAPGIAPSGLLTPGFVPRPALATLFAQTEILGEAIPLGKVDLPKGWNYPLTIYWFKTTIGPVAVTWVPDGNGAIPFPAELNGGVVVNSMGQVMSPPPSTLGASPVYVLGLRAPAGLQPPPIPFERPVPSKAWLDQRSVIVDILATKGAERTSSLTRHDAVAVKQADTFQLALTLYNFTAAPVTLSMLRLTLPPGMVSTTALPNAASVTIPAMGKFPLQLSVFVQNTTGLPTTGGKWGRIRVDAAAPNFIIAPAIAGIKRDS